MWSHGVGTLKVGFVVCDVNTYCIVSNRASCMTRRIVKSVAILPERLINVTSQTKAFHPGGTYYRISEDKTVLTITSVALSDSCTFNVTGGFLSHYSKSQTCWLMLSQISVGIRPLSDK